MLRGGITTYADMYYFEDAVARVTKAAGMRAVLGETILDFPAPDNKTVPAALAYAQTFLDRWKGDPLIVATIAPHSIYTCSERTLRQAAALARQNHAPILIHIAEARFEVEQSRAQHGVSPVQYLARIGLFGPDVLGGHCIWVDQADIATLAHFGVGCTFNPSNNMKTAAGLMPTVEMLAAGVPVGIATDGAAANNNQNLFEEMNLGAKLQKFEHMDPRVLPARQVVEMATIRVEEFAKELVVQPGVLLSPASIFRSELAPTPVDRFRAGNGRHNRAEGLSVWHRHLEKKSALSSAPFHAT
jgi:5-methylthioadenosine/S-adenosylhomocysteine deaminase